MNDAPRSGRPNQTDPDAAEEFAEAVGVDPTPEEVEHYRRLEGDDPLGDDPASSALPPAEPTDRGPARAPAG